MSSARHAPPRPDPRSHDPLDMLDTRTHDPLDNCFFGCAGASAAHMMEAEVDGEEVLNVIFDVVDLDAEVNQDLHNVERRLISKRFDRHGRKLVKNYYVYVYSMRFPVDEQAHLWTKIAAEDAKEPEERAWHYEGMKARLAALEEYHDQYEAASDRYDWVECLEILVAAQPTA